jgi:hypothetical protein
MFFKNLDFIIIASSPPPPTFSTTFLASGPAKLLFFSQVSDHLQLFEDPKANGENKKKKKKKKGVLKSCCIQRW